MNNQTMQKIVKFLFYLFAVAMLIATGMRTYSLLLRTTENVITAIFGLVAFEIGMLIWLAAAIFTAQGTGQRAIAFIASAINLLLVIAATALDVMLESQLTTVNKENIGWGILWAIIGATAINVIMLWLSHILDPHAAAELRRRAVQDAIDEEVSRKVEAQTPEIAKRAAINIAEIEVNRAVSEYANQFTAQPTPTMKFAKDEETTLPKQPAPLHSKNGAKKTSTVTEN